MKVLKVLALTKYGRVGASSRMRFFQYLPCLQQAGIQITVQPLLSDELLLARYRRGAYGWWSLLRAYACRLRAMLQRHRFDVLWIEKEALPWWPLSLERVLLRGVPYVLDYDDAVFHSYDLHSNFLVRHLYGRRLDGLMANAALMVGGNRYLAQRARDAGARWVEILPTVIDLARYPYPPPAPAVDGVARIVWIGTPATLRYLQLLCEPLQTIAKQFPFILRVIGGGMPEMPGVQVEVVPWAERTEVENIGTCAVGVMPLSDSPWERGKCGYKLIQYMACGLPVVASKVGANLEIVQHDKNGYLASTGNEWVAALGRLLEDKTLRAEMGRVGRQSVERTYCIQQAGAKMAELLWAVGGGR